jgi:electron transport complex protein RnfB
MHTVIESECTGCDLCLPPCPVDCIEMVVRNPGVGNLRWSIPRPAASGAALSLDERPPASHH